jgi:hypothetical protein
MISLIMSPCLFLNFIKGEKGHDLMAGTQRVIYDLLDKLIDSQISNTIMLTTLLNLEKSNQEDLKEINSHFSNGFRSEIKDHISEEQERSQEAIESILSIIQLHSRILDVLKANDSKIIINLAQSQEKIQSAIKDYEAKISERIEEETRRNNRIDHFLVRSKKISTYAKWGVAVIVAVATIVSSVATITDSWPWSSKEEQTDDGLVNE